MFVIPPRERLDSDDMAHPFGLSKWGTRDGQGCCSSSLRRSMICLQGLGNASPGMVSRMGIFQKCWHCVQRDPVFMRRVNGWLTMFWVAMIPVSLATGWVKSVTYVSALSLWALVAGHWSAWQAARVEEFEAQADIPGEVVKRVIKETEVERAKTSTRRPRKARIPSRQARGAR